MFCLIMQHIYPYIYVCIYGVISVKINLTCWSVIIYTLFLSCFTKEIEEVGQLNYLTLLHSNYAPVFSHKIMGEHHCRFQAVLRSYFVWLPHWSLTSCCFVLSALQYILHPVLKLLINLAFFLKKAFVYWENLVSLLRDHTLAGCLSWCHPSSTVQVSWNSLSKIIPEYWK